MQAGASVLFSTESDLFANTLLERLLSVFGKLLVLSGDSTNVCLTEQTNLFLKISFVPCVSSLLLNNKIPKSEDRHFS